METTVTDFVRVLRNAEVRVSPAETLDALQALDLVGYAERERVRQVLAATLAKTVEEKSIFDDCFERFFSLAPEVDADEAETTPGATTGPEPASEDEGIPQLSGLAQQLLTSDEISMQMAIDAAGRAAGIGGMRVFTQRGLYTRRVLEQMGWVELQQQILDLEQMPANRHPGHEEGIALKRAAERLRERVREYVERQYQLYASREAVELRESVLRAARLSTLERRDLQRLNRLVQRIARRLAARYSRRRRSFRRGLLDVPRTLRGGVAHDGIMFEPRWKSIKRDRPALVAVCDVSGSVRAYARFLLLFLYSLNDVLPRVRSFVFSSDLGEVTDLFERESAEVAVELAHKRWGGGATDYGRAFRALLPQVGRELDGGATLVILGDGRNNYGDPALGEFREMARRARRVIWLNPESKGAWGSGDSEMPRYRVCCTEARTCQTIAHLERFADDLLRKSL